MATSTLPSLEVSQSVSTAASRKWSIPLPVVLGSILALFVFLLVPRAVNDPDIWWHLENAKLQLATGSFLRHDVYSFSAAGSAWMNHEWLGELPFLLGWKLAGAAGVYAVTVLSVTVIMLGMFALAWKKCSSPLAALVAMLPALLLSSVSYGPRTLLFGWMLLLVELALLERFRAAASVGETDRAIWLLPLLFAVWINTHGSWSIGLVLLGLFLAAGLFNFSQGGLYSDRWSAAQLRTLLKVGGASVAALFLNPYGWRLPLYPFNMAFKQKLNIASVEEWRSVDFHMARGKIFLILIALLFLFRILQRRRWSLQEAAFAALALYSGLTYSRFLFLAAILLTPLLARDVAAWMPGPSNHPRRKLSFLHTAAFVAAAYLIFAHLPSRAELQRDPKYPIAAVEWANHHPLEGRTFNEYLWGGYIEFHSPALKPYIDSRMDIFEYNGTLRRYLDAVHLQNSLAILDQENIHNVFIEKDSPLAYLLSHTSGWKPVYQDDVAVVFTRG